MTTLDIKNENTDTQTDEERINSLLRKITAQIELEAKNEGQLILH